jgi:hypothetical protein
MSTNTTKSEKKKSYNTKAHELFDNTSREVDDAVMQSSSAKQDCGTGIPHWDAIIARWNWISMDCWCLVEDHRRNNIVRHQDCGTGIPQGNVQLTWCQRHGDVIHREVLQCFILIWELSGSATTS